MSVIPNGSLVYSVVPTQYENEWSIESRTVVNSHINAFQVDRPFEVLNAPDHWYVHSLVGDGPDKLSPSASAALEAFRIETDEDIRRIEIRLENLYRARGWASRKVLP